MLITAWLAKIDKIIDIWFREEFSMIDFIQKKYKESDDEAINLDKDGNLLEELIEK